MAAARRPGSRPRSPTSTPHVPTEAIATLARLVMTPPAENSTLLGDACAALRGALNAEDAYLVRAADPHFLRDGDAGDPTAYEITQKGYFIIWRELATRPATTAGLFQVVDRRIVDAAVLAPHVPASHLAMLLPGDDSFELLVARGPWPSGLSDDQVNTVTAARPLFAHLLSALADAQRRQRQREQLQSLSAIGAALTRGQEMNAALHALATAIAKASGFDWATLTLMNEQLDRVNARVLNLARHAETATGTGFRVDARPLERALLNARHIAATRRPLLYPNVFTDEHELPLDADLKRYYERGHVLSLATFPLWSGTKLLGTLSFSSEASRTFEPAEVEFLRLLTEQAALAIEWLSTHQQLQEANAALARAATHDTLTSLPNRALFLDRLAHALARARRTSAGTGVLFVDLDDFKAVNDSHGHEFGDRVLRVVADRLQRHLRTGDTAARFGGDEFLVLLEDVETEAQATEVAERLRAAIEQPVEIAGTLLTPRASIGVAWGDGDVESAEALIQRADKAMYAAKAHAKQRPAA
jgi:diguanylate cyclase (GGDEF)-like protein